MDLIGDRVVLKGFEGYRAQLDNRSEWHINMKPLDHEMPVFKIDKKGIS